MKLDKINAATISDRETHSNEESMSKLRLKNATMFSMFALSIPLIFACSTGHEKRVDSVNAPVLGGDAAHGLHIQALENQFSVGDKVTLFRVVCPHDPTRIPGKPKCKQSIQGTGVVSETLSNGEILVKTSATIDNIQDLKAEKAR